MKIGFVGLGVMGAPMAGHLIKGGHEVWLSDLKPVPASLVEAGGSAAKTAKEAAEHADLIITMVPDTPHVESALFGELGIAKGLSKGKIVVDMSSISPIATKEFARRINQLGCEYLDAPVSGGEVGAKAASLTIMVGGSEATFEKVKPILQLMGKNITLVGGEWRRPDVQGRQPDHRRRHDRGGRRGAALRIQGRRGPGARSARR